MESFHYNSKKKLSDFATRKEFISELHRTSWLTESREKNLSDLLNKPSTFYKQFSIPKKNNSGTRIIDAPKKDLKSLQQIIVHLILNQLSFHDFAFSQYSHAYQKNKGIFSNAQVHRNKKFVINIDLKDFFPSIHFGRVSGLFKKSPLFRLEPSMAYFFSNLCCYKGVLPQGSPTSPIISNLIGERLDRMLSTLSTDFHFTYSRYADDLTFSTNDMYSIKVISIFLRKVEKAINYNGFSVNWKKYRFSNQNVRHTVTGLSNNKKVSVTIDFYKSTRAMANSLYVTRSFFDSKGTHNGYSDESLKKSMSVIEGRYAFINDIENKNKQFYKNHSGGEEYHAVTPTDYREHHYVPSSVYKNHDFVNLYSGKKISYSKFLFYKKFLSGDAISVFTEGKTDPIYISSALKLLQFPFKISLTSFEIEKENKNSQFSVLFSLGGSGSYLTKVSTIYRGANRKYSDPYSIPDYTKYFKNKLTSIKPCILLFDYELNVKTKKSSTPLKDFINKFATHYKKDKDKIENKLSRDGYWHVFENLYIAVTCDLSGSKENRAIEDYFPDQFLNDPYGNKQDYFENAPCLNGKKNKNDPHAISKNDFSRHVRKLASTGASIQLFQGFLPLLEIFSNIELDYIRKVVYNISDSPNETLYSLLDSPITLDIISKDTQLKKIFLENFKKRFNI